MMPVIISKSASVSACNLDSQEQEGNINNDKHTAIMESLSIDAEAVTAAPANFAEEEDRRASPSRQCCCWRWSASQHIHRMLDRVRRNLRLEYELLLRSWKLLLFCVLFQYVHNIATNLVYYLHVPAGDPLPIRDLGFELFSPGLEDDDQQRVSEMIFGITIAVIVLFALSPLFTEPREEQQPPQQQPRLYVIVMGTRYARVLVLAQALRILSFLSTILPSPNFHCRAGAPDYDPPTTATEIIFRLDATNGCGDLIFSSHMIFCTVGGLTIHHYSHNRYLKMIVWALIGVLGCLIVAARKHYTVDVIVAWYTCPLLWFYCAQTYKDDKPRSVAQSVAAQQPANPNRVDVDEECPTIDIEGQEPSMEQWQDNTNRNP